MSIQRLAQSPDSFWEEQPRQPWWSWWHLLELASVFAIGLCVTNFMLAGSGGPSGAEFGVAGNDSYNHVKMAVLVPEIGLPQEFRWLRHVWLTEVTSEWVNHHYGFHVLLCPFVYAGKWLRGDFLTGGRWAVAYFSAACLTLFQLILMTQRVRCRWLWLALYLLMPAQFFYRHAFVRAIAPSLLFMLVIIALMFRRRYALAGLAVAAYTHLYMGGVIFGPLVVICYALAGVFGPRGDRVSWRLWMWTLLGWLVGVRTHPYFGGMLEFLQLQVFGTGLGADIRVGTEWKPYEKDLWWMWKQCAWTLIPLAAAVAMRLRAGPRVSARSWSVLLMSFVFAVLMFKSRRFIEYWPPFALLAAALLSRPVLSDWYVRLLGWLRRPANRSGRIGLGLTLLGLSAALMLALWLSKGDLKINVLTAEWRLWSLLAGAYAVVPMVRYWAEHRSTTAGQDRRFSQRLAVPVAASVSVCAAVAACYLASPGWDASRWLFEVPWWCFLLLGLAVVILAEAAWRWCPRRLAVSHGVRWSGLAGMALGVITVFAALLLIAGPRLASQQRSTRPKYDLPAIREMMAFLIENSPKDSVVFTDDWDVYPVYFYHNHHNNYCVGKDPKFTHNSDPVLWQRFRMIARGNAPMWHEHEYPPNPLIDNDQATRRKVRIRNEDIRNHFGADYVIVDDDHLKFRRKLDAMPAFCELIYPPPGATVPETSQNRRRRSSSQMPYVVYRVFSAAEQAAAVAEARRERRSKASPASAPAIQPGKP